MRGNGKMLLGALQEVWTTCSIKATQRKRGKSSRWLSNTSFISESPNSGKSLLSLSNIQQDKQGKQMPKRDFHQMSAIALEEKQKVNCLYSAELVLHLNKLFYKMYIKTSEVTLLSCHYLLCGLIRQTSSSSTREFSKFWWLSPALCTILKIKF